MVDQQDYIQFQELPEKTVKNSRSLRKNMTDAEKKALGCIEIQAA